MTRCSHIAIWVLVALAVYLVALMARAQDQPGPPTPGRVMAAIEWRVTNRDHPYLLPRAYLGGPALDEEYRRELAEAFLAASKRWGIPVAWLIGISYRETVYRPLLVGQNNEVGMMQVGAQGMRVCADHCSGYQTLHGSADCGACWLSRGVADCGGLNRGLFAHFGGRCTAESARVRRVAQMCHRLFQKIEEVMSGVEWSGGDE